MRHHSVLLSTGLLSLLTSCALTSCASIVSDASYAVEFDTSPSGRDIVIENESQETVYSGSTPITLTLEAGAGFFDGETYTVTAPDGSASGTLETGVDGWYVIGNLFFGGLIGYLIIDPATGAMFTLPDTFVLDLPSVAP